jgi:hypothetical protein
MSLESEASTFNALLEAVNMIIDVTFVSYLLSVCLTTLSVGQATGVGRQGD